MSRSEPPKYNPLMTVKDYVETLPFHQRIPIKAKTWIYGKENIYRNLIKTRQEVRSYVFQAGTQLRIPDHDYSALYSLSKNNWLLRQIFRTIIGEVINTRWNIEPRFKMKCKKCGKEYMSSEVDKCDICDTRDFDKPDPKQYKKAKGLIEKTFEGRTFQEFVRSTAWYDLALDDGFWEIVYQYDSKNNRSPLGYRVLDSTTVRPIMNQYGELGGIEYFCPQCYVDNRKKGRGDMYKIPEMDYVTGEIRSIPKCDDCRGEMVLTSYKQIINDKVVARWTEDEVIHVSSSRIDPEAFGNSKIIPCLKHLYTIQYMDEYNFQVYGHGHVGGFLAFEGLDQNAVETMKDTIDEELRQKDRQDVQTGQNIRSLEIATIFIGVEQGKPPQFIPQDIPLEKMQSIEYYKLYVEKVLGVFGVTPVFTSTAGEYRDQNPRMEIDVQNRVTKGYIKDIEDPFNNELLPTFGITDWILRFGKVESRDELRDAQIKLTNAQTVSILHGTGFDVEVAEDMGSYTVSSKPKRMPMETGQAREESGRISQTVDGAPKRTMAVGTEQGVPLLEPEAATREGKE